MILITDTAGFIGRAVVKRLAQEQTQTCCLLRPSRHRQRLPLDTPCITVSAGMSDLPALRTAMQGVTAILHLMGEDVPDHEKALYTHAQDTANLIEAAREVGVRRLIYLSRLEADRNSAYPLFRTRGEAEVAVRESGLDTTILQAAITYGPEDSFTNVLAMLAKTIPFILPIPDSGTSRFQPLWIEDLVTCLLATLKRDDLIGQTIPLGGPEHFTVEQMVQQVLQTMEVKKRLVRIRVPLTRLLMDLSVALLPRTPIPYRWLDVLTAGSATDLGTVPRHFGFEPCRFAQCLDYLRGKHPWRRNLLRFVFGST